MGAVVLSVLSSWLKINRLATSSVAACVIAIFTGTVWPLLVTIWFAFASDGDIKSMFGGESGPERFCIV